MYRILPIFFFLLCFDTMASTDLTKDLTDEKLESPYLKTVQTDRKLLDFSNQTIVKEAQEEHSLSLEEVNNTLRQHCYKITFEPKSQAVPPLELVGIEAIGLKPWNAFQRASKGDGVSTPDRAKRYKENYKVEVSDIKIEFINFKNCSLSDNIFQN